MITEHQVYQWLFEAVKSKARIDTLDAIHVSEVVGCLRRSYYLRTKPLAITPKSAILLLGNSIHEALQEVLRKQGFEIEYRVSLQLDGFKLVGTIDAYHPEEELVLELKTVESIPNEPRRPHYMQASIYSIMVRAKKCYLVYISRSDGKVKVFKVEPEKTALKWAVERAKLLRASLIAKQPPPREKSALCSFCEFALLQCRVYENGSRGSQ